jgi:hypothetical protein
MAFPTAQVTTTNLDDASDDPSLARADLLDAVQKLNTIIDEGGAANGVALLNSSGKLNSTQMPGSITASGVQVINPTSGVVHIQDVLRLTPKTATELNALSSVAGDIAYCSDGSGSSGEPTLAVYDGTNWRAIDLGGSI